MRYRLFLLPLLLVFLGAGCTWPEAGTPPTAMAPHECSHPYYPMKPDSVIAYQTAFGTTPGEFSVSVLENAGGQAKLEYQVRGAEGAFVQDVACNASGALRAKGYVDLASAISGAKFSVETLGVEGVLLPADLRVGSEWSASFDVNIKPEDNAGLKAVGIDIINQQVTINRRAVGMERVSVPVGTYDALKVEAAIKTDASKSGSNPLDAVVVNATEWWVQGVGLVKSESNFNGIATIMEAKSISTR